MPLTQRDFCGSGQPTTSGDSMDVAMLQLVRSSLGSLRRFRISSFSSSPPTPPAETMPTWHSPQKVVPKAWPNSESVRSPPLKAKSATPLTTRFPGHDAVSPCAPVSVRSTSTTQRHLSSFRSSHAGRSVLETAVAVTVRVLLEELELELELVVDARAVVGVVLVTIVLGAAELVLVSVVVMELVVTLVAVVVVVVAMVVAVVAVVAVAAVVPVSLLLSTASPSLGLEDTGCWSDLWQQQWKQQLSSSAAHAPRLYAQ
mmetsp:Transcript_72354/g.204484  ORF Transcript_72354/g.204484 Transcript_72354/m.204484 type:complete len:258 (-) Transcript_72354:436-1209(-)